MRVPDLQPITGRPCLVLGASGFLGRWLVRALREAGARVTAQVREARGLPPGRLDHAGLPGPLETLELDLTPSGSSTAMLRAVRPELVFNLAGYGVSKEERAAGGYRRLNSELPAELARGLLESPETRGAVLIHVGSALEYGSQATSLDELAPPAPSTDYGISKLAATLALDGARGEGLACLTARAFTVFGLGERPGRLVPSLLAAREGRARIPLSAGTQSRDWIYAEDLARALVELAQQDPEAIRKRTPPFDAPAINLASGALTSVREFTELFARAFDIGADRLGFGDIPGLAEEMHHPPVPVARLSRALGWTPPTDPMDAFRAMRAHLTNGIEA